MPVANLLKRGLASDLITRLLGATDPAPNNSNFLLGIHEGSLGARALRSDDAGRLLTAPDPAHYILSQSQIAILPSGTYPDVTESNLFTVPIGVPLVFTLNLITVTPATEPFTIAILYRLTEGSVQQQTLFPGMLPGRYHTVIISPASAIALSVAAANTGTSSELEVLLTIPGV